MPHPSSHNQHGHSAPQANPHTSKRWCKADGQLQGWTQSRQQAIYKWKDYTKINKLTKLTWEQDIFKLEVAM